MSEKTKQQKLISMPRTVHLRQYIYAQRGIDGSNIEEKAFFMYSCRLIIKKYLKMKEQKEYSLNVLA